MLPWTDGTHRSGSRVDPLYAGSDPTTAFSRTPNTDSFQRLLGTRARVAALPAKTRAITRSRRVPALKSQCVVFLLVGRLGKQSLADPRPHQNL